MFFLFLLVLVLTAPVMAEKDILLPQLVNPHKIIVMGDRIYIEDFPKIHIFSAKDYSLQKSFGEKGDIGPRDQAAHKGRTDSGCCYASRRLFRGRG